MNVFKKSPGLHVSELRNKKIQNNNTKSKEFFKSISEFLFSRSREKPPKCLHYLNNYYHE